VVDSGFQAGSLGGDGMAHTHAMSWPHARGAGRWGHWAPQILIGAIVASVVMVIRPLPPSSPAALAAPVLLVGAVVATWVQMRRHDRTLCELCMAGMPLNPSADAQRLRRRLAVAHLGSVRRAVVAYLLVLVAFDLLLVVVPPGLLSYASYLWAGMQSTLIYLVLAHSTHRRLQPWCARCREEGGGSGADAPEPLPFDSRST
jgi:hypothetical protein